MWQTAPGDVAEPTGPTAPGDVAEPTGPSNVAGPTGPTAPGEVAEQTYPCSPTLQGLFMDLCFHDMSCFVCGYTCLNQGLTSSKRLHVFINH